MNRNSPNTPEIACTLTTLELQTRLAWIAQLNADALREHCRKDMQLELTYAPEAIQRVREMVQRERQCCAFLKFTLREQSDNLRLAIEVPETGRDVAEIVFQSFLAGGPTSSLPGRGEDVPSGTTLIDIS